jgi:hypothetical protein
MFLILQTTNTSFVSSDGGRDYADLDAARTAATQAALEIAADEIRAGRPAVAVEAVLKTPAGKVEARLVTAIAVAQLCTGTPKG